MTKLCAEAMGYLTHSPVSGNDFNENGKLPIYVETPSACRYDPLHDDAQAMALMKKYGIQIFQDDHLNWNARIQDRVSQRLISATFRYPDLNRAIVECVVRMQSSKTS
jgi:hypothetical protein